jgi:WD40 repeat protein
VWNLENLPETPSQILPGKYGLQYVNFPIAPLWISSVALAANGMLALTGSTAAHAYLWDLSKPGVRYVLAGHSDSICSLTFSHNALWALTGSHDGTAILWDLRRLPQITSRVLSGHTGAVCSVALARDATWALTGSTDKTVRLWNLNDPDPIIPQVLMGHGDHVDTVSFTQDSKRALTLSLDEGCVRLWELSPHISFYRVLEVVGEHITAEKARSAAALPAT